MKTVSDDQIQLASSGLTPLSHGAQNRCFGCGQANRTGLRLKFFVDAANRIVCTFKLAKRFEGPPGYAHGGVIATLLDEAMSKANRHRGVTAMTRKMDIEYLRPVPLGRALTLEGWSVGCEGRKHHCEAQILNDGGSVLAKANGLFVAIDPARFRAR